MTRTEITITNMIMKTKTPRAKRMTPVLVCMMLTKMRRSQEDDHGSEGGYRCQKGKQKGGRRHKELIAVTNMSRNTVQRTTRMRRMRIRTR